MTTPGFFQQQLDPQYRYWFSDESIRYIQREVARRLKRKYIEYIEVGYDDVRTMLESTYHTWKNPTNLDDLLERVVCDYVQDIDTELMGRDRFAHCDPRTLYYPGTGITREERVKLKWAPKFEFQMNY